MFFNRKPKSSGLAGAVAELEQAVAARDGGRTECAFTAAVQAVQSASDAERVLAGPRLAALLRVLPEPEAAAWFAHTSAPAARPA